MTRRGAKRVIDGVSFAVRPGEIFGIGGLLGSGTEILETIFGANEGESGGEITLGGKPVTTEVDTGPAWPDVEPHPVPGREETTAPQGRAGRARGGPGAIGGRGLSVPSVVTRVRFGRWWAPSAPGSSISMKMHSPGHSSADSITASSWLSGKLGHALGTLRVALRRGVDLVAFLDVGEAVVEQGEHVGSDLLAEAVAGAEILVDPDLHRSGPPVLRGVRRVAVPPAACSDTQCGHSTRRDRENRSRLPVHPGVRHARRSVSRGCERTCDVAGRRAGRT